MQNSKAEMPSDDSLPEPMERYRKSIASQTKTAFPSSDLGLYDLLKYHLGWINHNGAASTNATGKALRPSICLLSCHLTGGTWNKALPAAIAIELMHNFSLIHDDIEDGDKTRRGRPTVWSLWGEPKATLAGNAMRSLADISLLTLNKSRLPVAVVANLSATLTARCLEMIEGQYLDISFEKRLDVTVEEYLGMISRKTGALIDCALYMGALIASQDEAWATKFGACGRLLGLSFQIRDDILGIWGDSNATGKATGADIRRKKKSLPVVYTLDKSRDRDKRELQAIYHKNRVEESDVSKVLEIMERHETRRYAQEVGERKREEAVQAIDRLHLEPWAREELRAVATYLIGRSY